MNRENKGCHKKGAAHWCTVTSCFNHLSSARRRHFVQAFQIALLSIRSVKTH